MTIIEPFLGPYLDHLHKRCGISVKVGYYSHPFVKEVAAIWSMFNSSVHTPTTGPGRLYVCVSYA